MYLKLATAAALGALVSTSAIARTRPLQQKTMAGFKTDSHERLQCPDEKIGDIKELMLDKNGRINNVAIGVGGF